MFNIVNYDLSKIIDLNKIENNTSIVVKYIKSNNIKKIKRIDPSLNKTFSITDIISIDIVKIKSSNKTKIITDNFNKHLPNYTDKPEYLSVELNSKSNIFYLTILKNHSILTIKETDFSIINNSNLKINMIDYANFGVINPNTQNIVILGQSLVHRLAKSNPNNMLIKLLMKENITTIAFIQDEYYDIAHINRFLNNINVKHVFTVLTNDHDIKTIYSKLNNEVHFTKCLTGYVNNNFKKYYKKIKDKKMHIFYRGRKLIPRYGELGKFKIEIGHRFSNYVEKNNVPISYDISNKNSKRILHEKWYLSLSNSKTTLATPSGSNVVCWGDNDFDFRLIKKLIYGNLFKDGVSDELIIQIYNQYKFKEELRVNAISPKMFEAIAMGTVLIMIEGDDECYSGILKPNIHYIPIKKDYSNLPEVIEKIKDDNYLQSIADKAYTDIIESNKYTIKSLCNDLDSVISEYI